MNALTKLPFYLLILLISFPAVNAVLYTPALPNIAEFFGSAGDLAQQTMTSFLLAYALGQLIYGPLINALGKKSTLYIGIILQIMSSLVCASSGFFHSISLLIVGRFFMALGAGVGYTMTLVLLNETEKPSRVSECLSYLSLSFAILPGVSVALGGFLTVHFGWISCFYAAAIYGLLLLFFTSKLSIPTVRFKLSACQLSTLLPIYMIQLKNSQLISGSLIMGLTSSYIYIFSSLAPYVAIQHLGLSTEQYGFFNFLPSVGLVLGSFLSARCVKAGWNMRHVAAGGLIIISIAIAFMGGIITLYSLSPWFLFLLTTLIYFGSSMMFSNASALAMAQVDDTAHSAALMSFIKATLPTIMVFFLGFFNPNFHTLLIFFGAMNLLLFGCFSILSASKKS